MAPSSGVAAFLAWPSTFLGPRHRWVSLVLGVAMQLCAGALYSVTAWGVPLRDRCGWNDGEPTLAETVGTLGIYLALHNGLAVDKHGARVVVVAASAALFVGWHLLASVARERGSAWKATLALYLIGQGCISTFMGSLAPNVSNFDERDQGKAHGVLLAGFGGSAALFATAYRNAFGGGGGEEDEDDLPGFFAAAGWATATVTLLGAYACKDGTKRDGGDGGNDVREVEIGATDAREDEVAVDDDDDADDDDDDAIAAETSDGPLRASSLALLERFRDVLSSRLFWLVYAHLVVTLGVALLWVNQAGSFVDAVVGGDDGLATMTVLFSLGNVFGRIGAGAASDAAERAWRVPRAAFLSVGAGTMAAACAVFASSSAGGGGDGGGGRTARYLAALGVGLAEGCVMAAWTAIARRAFGANRFGALIAMYNSAIAIGSASFNGVASAATGGGGGGGGGVGAWRAVFWAAAVASAGAVFVGAVATREMRRLAETSFEYVSVK